MFEPNFTTYSQQTVPQYHLSATRKRLKRCNYATCFFFMLLVNYLRSKRFRGDSEPKLRKSRSSDLFCSETPRKRLLRRLLVTRGLTLGLQTKSHPTMKQGGPHSIPGAEEKSCWKNSSGTLWGRVASASSPPPPCLVFPRINLINRLFCSFYI